MRALVAAAVAVSVMVATPGAEAAAAPDPVRSGVYVIGDSIANGVHRLVLTPERRPDGWHVEAVAGRRMSALGKVYVRPTEDTWVSRRRIFNPGGVKVRTAVLALGANAADEALTVAEAEAFYAEGIRRVRWHTGARRVVLVTAWRNPEVWHRDGVDPRSGAPVQDFQLARRAWVNSRAMINVAARTPGVCVMPWRVYANRHPRLFPDGVHPNATAREVWVRMVFRAVRACG